MIAPERRSKLSDVRQLFNQFFNSVYNYSVLGIVAISAMITGKWWLIAVGLGLEFVAMIFGPNLRIVRELLDNSRRNRDSQQRGQLRESRIGSLGPEYRHRCLVILARQQELLKIARNNSGLSRQLMRSEIEKTHLLVDAFIELVHNVSRLDQHLQGEDLAELEQKVKQFRADEPSGDPETISLARKNQDIIQQRIERLSEMNDFRNRALGQLSLIENSMRLLIDQVVSMRNPGELHLELDSLLDGVNSVREITHETRHMIAGSRGNNLGSPAEYP